MLNKLLFLLFLCSCWSLHAQTDIESNIQHKFGKSNYIPNQPYVDEENRVILITRIQYYLSNIELTHDGGQSVLVNKQHILMDGEISVYNLGSVSTEIQQLEALNFDLGVDPSLNSSRPINHPVGHALADNSLYSNDQQSYIFLAIEGMIDTDGDQTPDKPFSFHATGNQLFRNMTIQTTTSRNGTGLKINLVANIANWLKDIDLEFVGNQENSATDNEKLCDNTDEHSVFYKVATTSVNTLVSPQNQINVDSRLSTTPTIYYNFYTVEQLDMTITNINGTYFIQRSNLNPQGDFYMDNDLASGIYIVIFTTPKGIRQCKRFVVRN
ncbi:MAG: T9SS type A sorting domain-containing protein [Aureispira sp.]|nr:T9SS type A sorting domain-containing protein [Aureispira sp.]